jgi:hypothetical protein
MAKNLKIFISHSSKYEDLAKQLTLTLRALDHSQYLDIKLSEGMAGAVDWRKWIDDNTRSADVFLLLYPHASMDMGWCNYELGRFYDPERSIVCIKNTDIALPPPAFQPYQAYDASPEELMKFFKELFADGSFSKGEALHPEIGQIGSDAYIQANDAATSLAQRFAEARVREQLYERRLLISVRYSGDQFDREQTMVRGNAEGLGLLGLDECAQIRWSAVRGSLASSVEWPAELEDALPLLTNGALPPALSPFRAGSGLYIPVITKTDSVDGRLRQLVLIFVAVQEQRLRPLFTWPLPPQMPEDLGKLVLHMRMMFRTRWDILEPAYEEARFRAPPAQRCMELAQRVSSDFDHLQRDYEQTNLDGVERFFLLFDRSLHAQIEALSSDWMEQLQALRDTASFTAKDLAAQLDRLRSNSSKWLVLAARQFAVTMDEALGTPAD